MKQIKLSVIFMAALVLTLPAFAQQFDRDLVVKVMHADGAAMGQLGSALNNKDFAQATEKFKILADGMDQIKDFTPPKGSKDDYRKTMLEFIAVANRGIDACSKQDQAGAQVALSDLRALKRQGHGSFRS
jgi:hypothetical protein